MLVDGIGFDYAQPDRHIEGSRSVDQVHIEQSEFFSLIALNTFGKNCNTMHLQEKHLNQLSELAGEAALKAGKLIQSYTNKKLDISTKKSGNSGATQVVTEVDFQSQAIILEILKPSIAEFDIALLTEEREDNKSRLEKDYFWCIDPLDGTLPFTEGKPGYAVSIALISNEGIPVIGTVFDPVNNILYQAMRGKGVFRNNEIWNVPKPSQNNLNFYYHRSFTSLKIFGVVIEKLKTIARTMAYSGVNIQESNGSVMNAINVIENAPACYFAFPKKEEGGGSIWDFASTACLYSELDTWVSDIHGNPLKLNQKHTSFMNENGVLYASNNALAIQIQQIYKELS